MRIRLCRAFLIVFTLAAFWAVAVTLKGRFIVDLNLFRISSRSPRHAIIIAALSALGAWVATPGRRREVLIAEWRRIGPPSVVATLTVVVIAVALVQGARVAGGSDSYGYVSQAHLWTTGTPHGEPLIEDLARLVPPETLAPLGYRLAPGRTSIVPVYSPGFPMVMAVFERLGGREAVFFVVPLLGGLAVWATYLMGARLAGRTVGVSAAVLLATSPPFLFQLMVPMSDVPATAWWTLATALLPLKRRDAAFAAGIVAGAAILTRPNLAPVLIAPGALLAWQFGSERSRHSAQRLGLFMAGVIPACIGMAILNTRWYGSPLNSGYGSLEYLYKWSNLWPNVTRYSRWLLDAQTPAACLAVAGPFLLWRRLDNQRVTYERRAMTITLVTFIALVLVCYLFYSPFDAWWYLRFLLPAFPPLLVLMSVGLVSTATRVAGRGGLRDMAIAVIIGLLAWHGVSFARDHAAFAAKEGERKYVAVGNYIARRLPERAVIISMQFSGSIRYYSGRPTIRYDSIPEGGLDSLVVDLQHIGYEPYILIEDSERSKFLARFEERSRFAALDWPPVARFRRDAEVEIYDPVHKPVVGTESQAVTEIID